MYLLKFSGKKRTVTSIGTFCALLQEKKFINNHLNTATAFVSDAVSRSSGFCGLRQCWLFDFGH